MKHYKPIRGVMAALFIAAASISASAQTAASGANEAEKPAAPSESLKITLSLDQANLLDGLRTLMKNAKADFVIDDNLKEGTVTVHFTDVPFPDALRTVVKVSTLPIKYELKDGIYHFMRRPEDPVPPHPVATPEFPVRPEPKIETIKVQNARPGALVRALNGDPDPPSPPVVYNLTSPDGHGSVSYFGFNNGQTSYNNGSTTSNKTFQRSGAQTGSVLGLLGSLLKSLKH